MRKKIFWFILLISAITLNLGNVAFAANKVKLLKHKNIASQSSVIYAVAEAPDLEALKKEFYEETSKNRSSSADYTALLTKLSGAVSSADIAIPFLLDFSNKIGMPIYKLPATPSIRNTILFKYLWESTTTSPAQRLISYEYFQNETPSINYLSTILGLVSFYTTAEDVELNEKLNFYLSQLDEVIDSSESRDLDLLILKGKTLSSAGRYKYSIRVLRPLLDDPSITVHRKSDVLSILVESHQGLGDLETSLNDLLPYVKEAGYNLTRYVFAQAYRDAAKKYIMNNNYKDAIPVLIRALLVDRAFESLELYNLSEACRNFAKSGWGDYPESLISEIQSIPDEAIKTYAFMGLGNGFFEKKYFAKALVYLNKAYPGFAALNIQDPPPKNYLDSTLKELRFRIAYCYAETEDNWNAINYYKTLPENMDAQLNLALIWIDKFKSKRNAIEIINKMKKKNPEYYNLLMDRYDDAFGSVKKK